MKHLRGFVFPLLVLLLWQVGSSTGHFNSFIVPSPVRVLGTGLSLLKKGILLKHLGISMLRVIGGFALAFLFAFPLAVAVGMSKRLYGYLIPSLEFLRHIPPIATIPLLILWFGIGEGSKLAVIILATFFPIFMNTFSGIAGSQYALEEVGMTFGFSKWDIFRRIILPQAVPSILTGVQLGLGYSWRALMGAELVAASSGIGYMIIEAEQLSRIDIIFIGIIVIGGVGYVLDHLVLKLTYKYLKQEAMPHGTTAHKRPA